MDLSIIKGLCSHDFYMANASKLNESLFGDEVKTLFRILQKAHEKFGTDITTAELMMLWKVEHPVATRAYTHEAENLIRSVSYADDLNPAIVADTITKLHVRDLGKQIANKGLEIAEGNPHALSDVLDLAEKGLEGYYEDEFGPKASMLVRDVFAAKLTGSVIPFNIKSLAQHLPGVGRKEFGILFAVPEAGKTSFVVSLSVGAGGFVENGYKTLVLGNEEAIDRTIQRAYQSILGWREKKILEDEHIDNAEEKVLAATDGLFECRQAQDWDLTRIEQYIRKEKPAIVWIDQADKVQIPGTFAASHERLRELYRRLRETAKRYDCAVIGVSQAAQTATNANYLDYTHMEGSKIGKAAEADFIIGISKSGTPLDPMRTLTISKNKLTGWHGQVVCSLDADIARYEA